MLMTNNPFYYCYLHSTSQTIEKSVEDGRDGSDWCEANLFLFSTRVASGYSYIVRAVCPPHQSRTSLLDTHILGTFRLLLGKQNRI